MPEPFDLLRHNAAAWDRQALADSPWSRPVDAETVAAAKRGDWRVHLTPSPLPADWLEIGRASCRERV